MFGSTWTNPQQNQQQQQQPTAFGQPSGFGASTTTGAFGSGGAFGQPQQQQQQQPQANPMFGNLGGTTNTGTGTTGGGFGAFGGNTANTNTSAFGAKPATGFGAFGGGGAFGATAPATTSAFGQPANTGTGTTGIFGQPAASTATGGFGSSSIFGANKPVTTTAFGAPVAAATTPVVAPVVNTGTSNPPYQSVSEKDGNTTLHFQSISCMPAYSGYSFEELRVQDYNQGRKTAAAFGQSATFGTTPSQPAATGIFGAQPAQPAQTSIFGGGATNTANTGTGFGGFGQNANTNTATPAAGGGLFGGGTGTFGQPQQQQQQQTPAFGAFGQPQQQQQPTQSGGLFGGGTTGAFGAKPATTGFGAFGGTTGTTTGAFGAGGAFGAQNQQPAQQQTTNLFGQPQAAAPATGAFGGGAFGANTTAPKPSIFGAPATTQPATTGFGGGLFGQQQQQNQPQTQTQPSLFGAPTNTGGGLFGNNQQQQQSQQQQQQPATSLFGAPAANTQQQTGGLFGGGTTGGGLFGNNQQQQQPAQQQQTGAFGTGLFGGNKPAAPTGGLFGGSTFGQNTNTQQQQQQQQQQQGGGLFGGSLGQSTQQPALGAGLFGQKPATAPLLGGSTSQQPGGGLFGNTLGGSTTNFNASASNAGAQGTLTASISQPIGSDLPIFSLLPPGPRLVNLDSQQPKKKAGFFVDIPTRSPVPRVQLGYTPANSKLRGFASGSVAASTNGNPFNNNLSFSSAKSNSLTLNKSADSRAGSIGPDGFLGRSASPALGSGARQSVKKVILDKKVDPSELFIKSGTGSPGSLRGSKITFSPALSVAAREKEAASTTPSAHLVSPTPAARTQQRSPNRFTAQPIREPTQVNIDHEDLAEGEYWVKPSIETLKNIGHDQLSSFSGLTVGRVGYGQIEFLEPVDLTGLPRLTSLLGEVVRFEDKEAMVYPDCDEIDKPPAGAGVNVKARIILEKCWPVDKATRDPIKDPNHPAFIKLMKRLKATKETEFESFDAEDGKWTFVVNHF